MRYLFVLYLFVLIVFMYGCRTGNAPVIFIKSRTINIGSMRVNTTHQGSFLIKNTGKGELKIQEISSDCECTVIKNYKETIAPNQTEKIIFDLTPHVTGYDQQNIFIKNNSAEKTLMVVVRANVEL